MTAKEILDAMKPLGRESYNRMPVFSAPEYIRNVQRRGAPGKKRKPVKC